MIYNNELLKWTSIRKLVEITLQKVIFLTLNWYHWMENGQCNLN